MALTADSTIYELLQAKPEAAQVLFKFGMGCLGCSVARGESIREAAMAHGIPLKELLSALGEEDGGKTEKTAKKAEKEH